MISRMDLYTVEMLLDISALTKLDTETLNVPKSLGKTHYQLTLHRKKINYGVSFIFTSTEKTIQKR